LLDRDLVGHLEAVSLHADDLLGVVGEDPDRLEAEVHEDLRADSVVAQVCRQAELDVRVDSVEPSLLELVRTELVQQADPASLLGQVKQDAEALALDPAERIGELLAAVAAKRVEYVSGEAFGVDPNHHRLALIGRL